MLLHGFAIDLDSFLLELQHVGEGGEEWRGKKDTGYLYKAFRRCWRMQALRDGARTQGDRSRQPGKPTHPCIVGAGLAPALPRCPRPAALHSFFHSPAASFMVARRPPQGLLVMMMLMIRVIVTIRTGRRAPLSTPRFTRMPATGLAQNHPPPEVAR